MVNQLSKFTPNMASLTKPLRELLSTKKSWYWSHFQDEALKKVKMELTKLSVLALYSPDANSKSFIVWPGSSAFATACRQVETCGLCIPGNE